MRRTVLLLASVVLAVLLFAAVPASAPPTAAREGAARPNFVFILTDDMRKDDLRHMPLTRDLLVRKGTTFNNAFVPFSMCCTSRVSILRGQYTHNHEVWSNRTQSGGFEKFHSEGLEDSTVATWLKRRAGYHTVLLGKYLNNYPGDMSRSYVPPGWDE